MAGKRVGTGLKGLPAMMMKRRLERDVRARCNVGGSDRIIVVFELLGEDLIHRSAWVSSVRYRSSPRLLDGIPLARFREF